MEEVIKKELTLSRVLDAPRELVWKAWTDPKLLKQWWGPKGVFAPIVEFDAMLNGKVYIVMEAGEELGKFKGTQWPMTAVVKEIKGPEKLVLESSALLNNKPVIHTVSTLILEKYENNKTKMTLHIIVTKVTINGQQALAGMEAGWNQSLDKLVKFMKKEAVKI